MFNYSDFRFSDNVDDRRDRPDMTPEWKNVPGSLASIATSLGNTLWGMPQMPDVPRSTLGDSLGVGDIKLTPAVDSRSLLDRTIDGVTDQISMFRKSGEKLGSDTPFTQREFSKGYFAPQSFAPAFPQQRGLIDSIIGVESGGNPNATNPNSSATGLGQFIGSTWLDTIKAARPDLAQGKSDEELLALRTDPQLSREMTEAYANQNQAILTKAGIPVTPGSTYLAHFAGPGGAVKVMQADPNAPVESVLGPGAVQANPFLRGMTVQGLQAWADKKMGGAATRTAATPQAAPQVAAAPPSAPLQLAPQPPPIFAAAPQPAQQQPQGGGLFGSMPAEPMQAPPIFFAPRRQPDLSKLRAAFKAPVFSRG